jgi:nitroimidazol reductase NimA-like FMN-containing flavoprotein (pyridoxamine 5'-phosphate oxidase superfamily)
MEEWAMPGYHMRRTEKEINDPKELEKILSGQRIATFAMCRDTEPYLVTLNYAYVPESRSIYFHSASAGKKLDFIRANPRIWGQVLEDGGYIAEQCDHRFRSVHFWGAAEIIDGAQEKRAALSKLIERQETEHLKLKAKLMSDAKLDDVTVIRIWLEGMSGKSNPKPSRPSGQGA